MTQAPYCLYIACSCAFFSFACVFNVFGAGSACANSDIKFMDKHAAQEERMENLRLHFSQVSSTLANKFRSFMEHEHEHFTDICRAIDKRVTQQVNSFDGQLSLLRNVEEQHNQHHVTVCADMDRHFTDICNEIQAKYAAKNASQDRRVEDMSKNFLSLHTNMDQTFQDKTALQDEVLESYRGDLSAAIQQLDRKCLAQGQDLAADILGTRQMISNNTANLISEMTSLRSEHASRLDELGQTIEGNSRHCVDMYSKLDQNSVEHHQHFTNVCAAMDAKHGEKIAAMDTREQNRYQKLTEMHDNTVRLFDGKHLEQGIKAEEQHAALINLRRITDDWLTRRDEDLNASLGQLRCLVEKYQQDLRDMGEGIEKKLVAKDSAQDRRLDDMREAIEANHMHFTEVAKTMHSQFSDEITIQKAKIEKQHDETKDAAKTLRQQQLHDHSAHALLLDTHYQHFTEVCTKLDTELAQQTASCKNLVDALGDAFARNRQHFTDVCAGLDEKFSTTTCAQHEVIKTNHQLCIERLSDWKSALDDMAQSHETQLANVTASTNAHRYHLDDIVDALSRKSAGSIAAVRASVVKMTQEQEVQNQRLDGLDTNIHATRSEFSNRCSDVDTRLANATQAQMAEMAQNRAVFGKVCADLQRKLSDKDSEQDTAIADIRKQCVKQHDYQLTICSKLDQKFAKVNADQLDRTHRQSEHFTDVIAALEERLRAKNFAQDEHVATVASTVDAHFLHFSDLFNALEIEIAAAEDQHAAVSQDLRKEIVERCGKIDLCFVEHIAIQDCSMNGLRNSIQQHLTTLQLMCDNIDVKLTGKQAIQDATIINNHKHCTELCSTMNQSLATANSAHSTRIDTISAAIETQSLALEASLAGLDESFKSINIRLTTAIEDNRSHIDEIHLSLRKDVAEDLTIHDTRIEELRSVMKDQSAHVADEFKNMTLKLSWKIGNLEQSSAAHFAHFTEACSGKFRQHINLATWSIE
eukprot:COSAG05_NODE_234_length_13214_cov_161.696454_3_plen_981_part_00